MSKVDAMRALREARMAAQSAPAKAPAKPAAVKAPAAKAPVAKAPVKAKAAKPAPEPAAEDEACGHRSMNGRTCTRPSGHAEKNHRYG